jgi:hypothetical protein
MIRYWIFQALPEEFDIQRRLQRGNPKITTWEVNQHANEVKEGDRAFLWACKGQRPSPALCGFVEVLCDPMLMDELSFELPFYPAGSQLERGQRRRVMCRIIATTWITKDAMLQTKPALASLPNVQQPQGTNYPLNEQQAGLLMELTGVW